MTAPEIITIDQKTLVGRRMTTTLSENKTEDLWTDFMKNHKEINSRSNDNFYSVQIYPNHISFQDFTPITNFEKWAAVEVEKLDDQFLKQNNFEKLLIPQGKYARFIHKGTSQDFFRSSQHIFGVWLPNSEFELDNRPHFEEMSPSYKGPSDPTSEEYVYIPIK